ncbi:DJ-1/PfpI family protein [Pseudomonas sp. VS40]|uniref:DJ-1/PfpI family protein n=1 Tax=unclassified Pseudomonas TaxID=196821 RepID=UPI001BDF6BB5|nr:MULTISPECIES: DJ-1/PfpI family protein [unclassified Pseudomonas]MBT1260412.1 DJ-1/PfpI family protein [Pseudomonas sp. VS40]MBT1271746.1 DJ-1/PfpI family protein [Pseudomonas sp. VS59]
MSSASLSVGFLLYPELTQLDLTAAYEVFARAPNVDVHLIWKTQTLVKSDLGLEIMPNASFEAHPKLDIICVPGGPGQIALMDDQETLDYLRRTTKDTKLITSVCTGSLVLGAAGLLEGYRATSHWSSLDQLSLFGATPVAERVVWDRDRVTGAGVTSGIEFALTVIADTHGREIAEEIQLQIEYDPAPPFSCGSPEGASRELLDKLSVRNREFMLKRRNAAERAAARLQALS